MERRAKFDVHEISLLLETRRKNRQTTVLLLGSRAGALFRSPQFYENLEKYSDRHFHPLSLLERFQECYTILAGHHFGERDIHGILRTSLSEIGISRSDACLAELIKQGHFEEIISTNVDNVLEQALMQADMTEGRDYEVYIAGKQSLQLERIYGRRLTKAYGDLQARVYVTSPRLLHLDENQELMQYLQHLFEKDVLILGFDPIWDRDILHAFPAKGGVIWFISEEKPAAKSLLSGLLKERRARSLLSGEGTYERFVTRLHEHLYGEVLPMNYLLATKILEQLQELRKEHQFILDEIKRLQKQTDTL